MSKAIKKPVAIEYIEWTGKNLNECIDFLGDSFKSHKAERHPNGRTDILIKTLEGEHIAAKGDMIIKGIRGEYYPCKPDIFKLTYYTEQEWAEL